MTTRLLNRRLRRIEDSQGPPPCPECGATAGEAMQQRLVLAFADDEDGPEREACSLCGRTLVMRITFDQMG